MIQCREIWNGHSGADLCGRWFFVPDHLIYRPIYKINRSKSKRSTPFHVRDDQIAKGFLYLMRHFQVSTTTLLRSAVILNNFSKEKIHFLKIYSFVFFSDFLNGTTPVYGRPSSTGDGIGPHHIFLATHLPPVSSVRTSIVHIHTVHVPYCFLESAQVGKKQEKLASLEQERERDDWSLHFFS